MPCCLCVCVNPPDIDGHLNCRPIKHKADKVPPRLAAQAEWNVIIDGYLIVNGPQSEVVLCVAVPRMVERNLQMQSTDQLPAACLVSHFYS